MCFSRRQFLRASGATALLAAASRASFSATAGDAGTFRAMVGVFLFGGADNWNMIVPTDTRYDAYAAGRGSTLALPKASLSQLSGVPFGLHPSFAPLATAWNEGALNPVLNVGSLFQPLTKAIYQSTPAARPLNLMSHEDEQSHWQGLRMREVNPDGFMGRMHDREGGMAISDLLSFAGSSLATIGKSSLPLILPSSGGIVRNGYNAASTDAVVQARQSAASVFADATGLGAVAESTAQTLSSTYSQVAAANTVLTASGSTVDQYFKNPTSGATLTSDISRQLLRVARMIEARSTLGHTRQTFFTSQGGYDTHSGQVDGNNTTGTQANLYADLAMAMAGFYNAMKALGLQDSVTLFTMSDFGRTFKANAQRGTDHAWGNNHLVLGGAVRDRTVQGGYPDVTLGGAQDIDSAGLGRWIPTLATDEYIGAIAQWYGVSAADMSYVFPNWTTWTSNGRGPIPLFA